MAQKTLIYLRNASISTTTDVVFAIDKMIRKKLLVSEIVFIMFCLIDKIMDSCFFL